MPDSCPEVHSTISLNNSDISTFYLAHSKLNTGLSICQRRPSIRDKTPEKPEAKQKPQVGMTQRILARLAVASFCVVDLPTNQLLCQTSDQDSESSTKAVSFQFLVTDGLRYGTYEFEGERPFTPSEMSMICGSTVQYLSVELTRCQSTNSAIIILRRTHLDHDLI